MTWKTKRLLATAGSVVAVYLVMAFIKMDFFDPLARESGRVIFSLVSIYAAAATYFYPSWKWDHQ